MSVTHSEADISGPPARTILINAIVAAVLGQAVMILLHEAAHWVTGALLGHPSTMFAFGVTHDGDVSVRDDVIMLMSAPVFSLVTGIILQRWLPFRRRGGFVHLFWLFLAFTSVQETVTYLVITPFGAGDTGTTATLLGIPVIGLLAICLVGIGGMFANAAAFAPHLRRHAGNRARNAFSLFPWLFGMLIGMALSFLYLALTPVEFPPADQIAVIAGSMGILVFAPMANIFLRNLAEEPTEPLRLRPVPVGGLIALAVMILINIALSLCGLRLG